MRPALRGEQQIGIQHKIGEFVFIHPDVEILFQNIADHHRDVGGKQIFVQEIIDHRIAHDQTAAQPCDHRRDVHPQIFLVAVLIDRDHAEALLQHPVNIVKRFLHLFDFLAGDFVQFRDVLGLEIQREVENLLLRQ